jgi:type III secretion system YscI/HrpB-like protein
MTDLSGIQQAVQKIAEQTVQDQAKSGTLDKGAASAEDIQKLQSALNQPPAEAQAAGGPSSVQGVEQVAGVQGVERATPGARILDSVNNMRTGVQDAFKELANTVANMDSSSPADLLQAQMKLQQVTLQQDLMSKVVSKSEQNVDQLLKGQ